MGECLLEDRSLRSLRSVGMTMWLGLDAMTMGGLGADFAFELFEAHGTYVEDVRVELL